MRIKTRTGVTFALFEKQDVLAILPTGFIKSLINQSFTVVKSVIDAVVPTVIIIMSHRKDVAIIAKSQK